MISNIVTARFTYGNSTKTRGLHQWDYGQVLQFEGLDLPSTYTVHFANQLSAGNAKTQVGGADGVSIPDEYLTTGLPVYAWVYLHTGESDGETVYSVMIPVTARPRPVEDAPTPVQQGAIDTAIAALNAGVEQVEGIAEAIPQTVDAALEAAKESGEFDGPPGRDGTDGLDGRDGTNGVDGYSPTAVVTQTSGGATISITDKNGTTAASISNGTNGQNGSPGQNGQDGYSPTASVSKSGSTATITITDKSGTTTAQISDGQNGAPGADGYSPTATVTKSGDTATISITDKNGTTTAQVSDGQNGTNGQDGAPGVGVPSGGTTGQVLSKASGTDYDTAWIDKNPVVQVSGSTPTITALPGVRYVCGECATLDITLPASGIVDVVFESGSTPTVLTVTPPTGVTVKWANGFDPTALEANTTYEINIADGLGVAGQWT